MDLLEVVLAKACPASLGRSNGHCTTTSWPKRFLSPRFPNGTYSKSPIVFWVRRVGGANRSALAGRGYPHSGADPWPWPRIYPLNLSGA